MYPSFEGAHLISETPELKDGCRLEVLADDSLVEIYINDGEYVISNAVYGLGKTVKVSGEKTVRLLSLIHIWMTASLEIGELSNPMIW